MKENDIVVGLLFGDEGKGATVDALTAEKETNAVVRFSGGSQTAHNVVTPDGRHHTFSQIGSGTFNGVRTILSKHMLINPFNLMVEAESLQPKAGWDFMAELLISENALMTTPMHAVINRKREILRGGSAHGSCGLGIGETQNFANHHPEEAPRIRDLKNLPVLQQKLDALFSFAHDEVGDIFSYRTPTIQELMLSYTALMNDRALNIVTDEHILQEINKGYNVFEGSQGVLLDESFGFHPHTTWSTVTQQNAQSLLSEAGLPVGRTIGAIRSYFTRHGYGPFPSEQFNHQFPEVHNTYGQFQGGWRAGLFDMPLFEYAVRANQGVDEISISHMDLLPSEYVKTYDRLPHIPTDFYDRDRTRQEEMTELLTGIAGEGITAPTVDRATFLNLIEETASAPITIEGAGPTWKDRKVNR